MPHRYALAAALLLGATALEAPAQDFGYQPGSATYRASVTTTMTRSLGAQRLDDEMIQTQRLTVALTPQAADTLRIAVTIDSATASTRSLGAQDVTPLLGLRVVGKVSRLGASYPGAVAARELGPQGAVLANDLARFLPRVRRDLRPGLAWTDTTTETVDMLGVPVRREVITVSTVAGDTLLHGQQAWRIDRSATVSFAGNGTVGGRAITLRGSSSSGGRIYVGRSGRYLGSEVTDSATTTFEIPATGQQVGLTQKQRTVVELLTTGG